MDKELLPVDKETLAMDKELRPMDEELPPMDKEILAKDNHGGHFLEDPPRIFKPPAEKVVPCPATYSHALTPWIKKVKVCVNLI